MFTASTDGARGVVEGFLIDTTSTIRPLTKSTTNTMTFSTSLHVLTAHNIANSRTCVIRAQYPLTPGTVILSFCAQKYLHVRFPERVWFAHTSKAA